VAAAFLTLVALAYVPGVQAEVVDDEPCEPEPPYAIPIGPDTNPWTPGATPGGQGEWHYSGCGNLVYRLRAVPEITADLAMPSITHRRRAELLVERAVAFTRLQQTDAALRDYSEAIESDAAMLPALKSRAQIFEDRKQHDLAAADWARIIALEPSNHEARAARAYNLLVLGRPQEGIVEMNEALRLNPDNYQYLQTRASLHESAGEWQNAVDDFTRMITLDSEWRGTFPANAPPISKRGRALVLMNKLEKGIADLKEALRIDPDEGYTMIWLYIANRKAGIDDAAWLKSRADKATADEWSGRVLLYFAGRVSDEDLITFAQTNEKTRAAEQSCDGWFFVGEVALLNGDREKAARMFRETISHCTSVDYEYPAAKTELARIAGG
jgi:lipoprotein NlpI